MLGLAYLAAFAVYLIISLIVVLAVATRAKTWKWRIISGVLTTLFMYNLVFWDYLPTKYAYEYYCKKEAGFWVYKTAEQWRAENPDVVVGPVKPPEGMVLDKYGKGEMVMPDGTKLVFTTYRNGDQSSEFYVSDGRQGHWLNDRFIYLMENQNHTIFNIWVHTESVIDSVNQQLMYKKVNVGSGGQLGDIRFWLKMRCGSGIPKEFFEIGNSFYQIGVNKL